jgi:2-amino-4-hydroxy-6-hydroxymethyldihydropteridine diphosphokinase
MTIGHPGDRDAKKKSNRAVIAFGSNIDPESNIERAIREISGFLTVLAVSDVVTTRPIGNADQPHFRNGAVLVETGMGKAELEERLHAVETGLGRLRTPDRYGPRTMDLDVIWWNGQICHPDAETRDFVKTCLRQVLDRFTPDRNLTKYHIWTRD